VRELHPDEQRMLDDPRFLDVCGQVALIEESYLRSYKTDPVLALRTLARQRAQCRKTFGKELHRATTYMVCRWGVRAFVFRVDAARHRRLARTFRECAEQALCEKVHGDLCTLARVEEEALERLEEKIAQRDRYQAKHGIRD